MVGHQLKLLRHPDRGRPPGGPVFEFGPGWGAKIKKWSKKYLLGGNCTLCRVTRYVLLFGVVILVFGGPQLKEQFGKQHKQKLAGQIKIAEVVNVGDSRIKLARRALSDYLAKFPDPTLGNGHKVFIETTLGQELDDDAFRVGTSIDFVVDDIKSAIEKSRSLTPYQLQRWEDSARKVKF